MKTMFKYGVRSADSRHVASNIWLCDNPRCEGIRHFDPCCPNRYRLVLEFWRFRIYFG